MSTKKTETITSPGLKHSAYVTSADMKGGCFNPKHDGCERYKGGVLTYVPHGATPSPAYSEIDRIDNDDHDDEKNCRWLTRKEHAAVSAAPRKTLLDDYGGSEGETGETNGGGGKPMKPETQTARRLRKLSRDYAEHKMYYINQIPREVPLGLILVHTFPVLPVAIK
jgi:hypothetical protein